MQQEPAARRCLLATGCSHVAARVGLTWLTDEPRLELAQRDGRGVEVCSRVRSPGVPAAVAQVPSAGVGMELPAVNLKVAARPGRAGVLEPGERSWSRRESAEPKGGGSRHREGHLETETDRATPPGQTQAGTGPGPPAPALLMSPSSTTETPLLLSGQTPSSAVPLGPSVGWHRLGEIQCPQTIVSSSLPHAVSLFHN